MTGINDAEKPAFNSVFTDANQLRVVNLQPYQYQIDQLLPSFPAFILFTLSLSLSFWIQKCNIQPPTTAKMFSSPPHLTTFRPSPNTISFIVSTASPSQLHHHVTIALRVLVGLFTVLVLLVRYLLPPPPSFAAAKTTSGFLVPLANRVRGVDWIILAPVALGTLFLVFRRFYIGMLRAIPPVSGGNRGCAFF